MFWEDVARRAFGMGGGDPDRTQSINNAPKGRRLRLGLALGGGAARGWAHIGVVRRLVAAGFRPDVIAGTSIGALVGGCLAADKLDELESFARSLTKRRVLGLLDIHLGGSGLIGGDRLKRLLDEHLREVHIEDLETKFAAIATEYATGHEVWLSSGNLIEAMRASYALPGVFNPVRLGGRWLMDGALVNPIPVTTARALGADIVVCINLNIDLKSRGTTIQSQPSPQLESAAEEARLIAAVEMPSVFRGFVGRADGAPGLAAVMVDAFNITQDRIARSRLAGDPPDVMIQPKLGKIGLFEFHRAEEAIRLGEEAAERCLPDIAEAVAAA